MSEESQSSSSSSSSAPPKFTAQNPRSRLVLRKITLENFKVSSCCCFASFCFSFGPHCHLSFHFFFQSYGGYHEVGPFHHQFSSVVGPNGSGKSNVIDRSL